LYISIIDEDKINLFNTISTLTSSKEVSNNTIDNYKNINNEHNTIKNYYNTNNTTVKKIEDWEERSTFKCSSNYKDQHDYHTC
jgi:hypothetical protein